MGCMKNGIREKEVDFVFIDDYAHHPTEISAVHQAIREMHAGERITVIFQPHLFSRSHPCSSGQPTVRCKQCGVLARVVSKSTMTHHVVPRLLSQRISLFLFSVVFFVPPNIPQA